MAGVQVAGDCWGFGLSLWAGVRGEWELGKSGVYRQARVSGRRWGPGRLCWAVEKETGVWAVEEERCGVGRRGRAVRCCAVEREMVGGSSRKSSAVQCGVSRKSCVVLCCRCWSVGCFGRIFAGAIAGLDPIGVLLLAGYPLGD